MTKHRQFGVSSEKGVYDQLSLFNEAEAIADNAKPDEPQLTVVEQHYLKKARESSDRLLPNLPVETVSTFCPQISRFAWNAAARCMVSVKSTGTLTFLIKFLRPSSMETA